MTSKEDFYCLEISHLTKTPYDKAVLFSELNFIAISSIIIAESVHVLHIYLPLSSAFGLGVAGPPWLLAGLAGGAGDGSGFNWDAWLPIFFSPSNNVLSSVCLDRYGAINRME